MIAVLVEYPPIHFGYESGDWKFLIASATLFDLLGSKVLASMHFTKSEITDEFLESAVLEYYNLIEENTAQKFITTKIGDRAISVLKVGDVTVLIVVGETDTFTEEEITSIKKLDWHITDEIENTSVREFKDDFQNVADLYLRNPVNICIITVTEPLPEDTTSSAVELIIHNKGGDRKALSQPISIGPNLVHVTQYHYHEILNDEWPKEFSSIDIFALIVSGILSEGDQVEEAVQKIRSNSKATIVVVPGSDEELERARDIEMNLGIDLCDSVSPKPTHLLLSIMAYGGLSDLHPELARERWIIEEDVDKASVSITSDKEELGHQAFFVVDRRTGEAAYSYYYEERSRFLEMAPNIVAAITSFKIDQSTPTETSVFRTGDLSYITIERDNYIFTLITGKDADVTALRSRFSFLPDLFLDEVPPLNEDPTDLFRSPLFTLKLLATLPSIKLAGKIAPIQKRALNWDRFEHPPVRDFLEAVWQRLDGSLSMNRLVPGKGPELILGAIHLLHRLESIDFVFRILLEDVPILMSTPDDEILSLYANLETILEYVDGDLTIFSIARAVGVDPSVLVAVFTELHKRGVIAFKE
ncbi:hypothetical protein EU528_06585 [Candidatus Thorarchaeota archaeon]|nr:MAG: hypothetical protein EU528_06585 [Candidatus Thorarchaeota archaeon]